VKKLSLYEGNEVSLDYEAILETVYRKILRPGDAVLDVGAHRGRHTLPFAEIVGAGGSVVAVEPIPQMFDALSETVAQSAATTYVELYNVALGAEAGSSAFVLVTDWPEYSGLRQRLYDSGAETSTTTIEVAIETVDRLMVRFDRLAMIKIDVEGGEYDVLRGARSTISRTQPVITFECGDNSLVSYEHNAGDIFDFFQEVRYEVFDVLGKVYSREELIKSSAEQGIWDYIGAPRGDGRVVGIW
jgi:FkbM family methyltransferase